MIIEPNDRNRSSINPLNKPISENPRTEIHRRKPSVVPVKKESRVDQIFKNKRSWEFAESTGFRSGPLSNKKNYKLILWSFVAAFIDLLILTSLSSFFILSFKLIVKTSVAPLLHDLSLGGHIHMAGIAFFSLVFLMASWFYLTLSRVFLGATIGEWSCGICLGHPAARGSAEYFFKVLARSTIIVLTGLFVLPIVSLFFGKDLVGELVNLKLMELK